MTWALHGPGCGTEIETHPLVVCHSVTSFLQTIHSMCLLNQNSCPKEEVWAVNFLTARYVSKMEIQHQLIEVYGEGGMSHHGVAKW